MVTNAGISPSGSMIGATGLRARIAAITSFLGRFPLSVHQLLFRWAIAGVFFRTGLQKVRGWEIPERLNRIESPAFAHWCRGVGLKHDVVS
jgi:hypothetical protein